nr:MAG TPA: Proteasome subunit alpha type-2 [Caudoviricetes sp.]
MSLVMAIANKNGIVISADKRLTCKTIDSNTGLIVKTQFFDTEQKMFVTKSGHVIAHTGESVLSDGRFIEDAIKITIQKTNNLNLCVRDELLYIKSELSSFAGLNNTRLLAAGVEDNTNNIYTTSLKLDDFIKIELPIFGIGELSVAQTIHNTFAPDIEKFTIEETIDYLCFLNYTANKLNGFCKKDETISSQCDICIITTTGTQFVPYEVPSEIKNESGYSHRHLCTTLRNWFHNLVHRD